jgi:predicted DsbA family dithiol-disulfide isomerase
MQGSGDSCPRGSVSAERARPRLYGVNFTARIYFDYTSRDVFLLYGMLSRAQRSGASIGVDWRAFPASSKALDRPALAASELVRDVDPQRHGAFVQALLAAAHLEDADMADNATLRLAAVVAGLSPDVVSSERVGSHGVASLDATESEARGLSVTGVPTLYRQGPVLKVRLVGAADDPDALRRLRVIDGVMDDDVIWELSKP